MADSRLLCQEGEVVARKDNHYQVKILTPSACSLCHAKGMCTTLDRGERIIDAVVTPIEETLTVGERVNLVMEERWGWWAVFYGFLLPFVVMITVLFISYALGSGETGAALYGIGSLVPYYLLLYGFRSRITRDLVFKAEKQR
jgi:positive regulator of sigma E activity